MLPSFRDYRRVILISASFSIKRTYGESRTSSWQISGLHRGLVDLILVLLVPSPKSWQDHCEVGRALLLYFCATSPQMSALRSVLRREMHEANPPNSKAPQSFQLCGPAKHAENSSVLSILPSRKTVCFWSAVNLTTPPTPTAKQNPAQVLECNFKDPRVLHLPDFAQDPIARTPQSTDAEVL